MYGKSCAPPCGVDLIRKSLHSLAVESRICSDILIITVLPVVYTKYIHNLVFYNKILNCVSKELNYSNNCIDFLFPEFI